jgi:hypothetical protein
MSEEGRVDWGELSPCEGVLRTRGEEEQTKRMIDWW